MHLRWKLCVVLGGGTGVGHEVSLRLARAGAGVLVADPDLTLAEETAAALRGNRVSTWSIEADPADDRELELLAARARDLGGADLVVVTGVTPARGKDVAAALLAEPQLVGVLADDQPGGDARTAIAVVDLLGTADAGTVVVVA
ncbi:SDR family NAD(P)-dependent oxidoreductase [Nocardioides dongkuii]|uniref:SDR family NAD(P)-dependent oxidoreductase n=1 Tax=Nocardioides dongkuii TaxID=2760089 RepID=UPI0018780D56|nr:SDR family NAD(P)-dependent oxidoreductase [Nocardioides dongkuii]